MKKFHLDSVQIQFIQMKWNEIKNLSIQFQSENDNKKLNKLILKKALRCRKDKDFIAYLNELEGKIDQKFKNDKNCEFPFLVSFDK